MAVFAFFLIVALLIANAPLWVTIPLILLLSVIHGVLALRDHQEKVVALNYELDEAARTHYVEFLNAMQAFAGSSRIWRSRATNTALTAIIMAALTLFSTRRSLPFGWLIPLVFRLSRFGRGR